MRLRTGRLTASNFGSANHNNTFATPADLLRQMLWPYHMESNAMKYGSVNEKVALRRLAEFWVTTSHHDLPVYIDEPTLPFPNERVGYSPEFGCRLVIPSWQVPRTVCSDQRGVCVTTCTTLPT